MVYVGKVEERANKVLAHKKYYILLTNIYILVLVRATLVSSLLFPSLNSSSTSKTKGKRYHHFNHYDSQGVAEDSLWAGFGLTID